MRYFRPPSNENWRMVRVVDEPNRVRIDWFPPTELATTWNAAMRSVQALRERSGVPDWREALAIGLLQPVTDARVVLHLQGNVPDVDPFFIWEHNDDYANSDAVAVVRLHTDGSWLMGIACRVRPPCEENDRNDLLFYMLNQIEQSDTDPQPDVSDPPYDAQLRSALEALDDAFTRNNHMRALEIAASLKPYLLQAPLSRLAMDLALVEGWAAKRRAFDGDPEAASQSIDLLRKALDDMDEDVYPEIRSRGMQWLAEAYAKRDAAGDIERSIRAYQDVVRLTDEPTTNLAWVHLRIGVLEAHLGTRLPEPSRKRGEYTSRAVESFERAESIFEASNDLPGRIETTIAIADALRMSDGPDDPRRAADTYGRAWSLLTVGGAQEVMARERWIEVARHVLLCMRELDVHQFGETGSNFVLGQTRANGLLLRPLLSTRALTLHPPQGWPTRGGGAPGDSTTLELALGIALSPDVWLEYVGGTLHPLAAGSVATTSEAASWQSVVQMNVEVGDLFFVVPGDTPGMQWELRFLTEEQHLDSSIIIMVPSSSDPEARQRWESARAGASTFGLELPPYDHQGAFLRFDNNRGLFLRLPFQTIWKPRALIAALEDLMLTPEDYRRQHEESLQKLSRFEKEGRISRNP